MKFSYRFYPLIVGVQGFYCCIWSQSMTHTLGRTPLDEGSARLITHTTHKVQICMPSAGFEPPIPASLRPQTHALDDGAATGIASKVVQTLNPRCSVNIKWQVKD